MLLAAEALRDLPTQPATVRSPISEAQGARIGQDVVVVPVLRVEHAEPDEQAGGERVCRATAHRLVGGMADVGRGLANAAAQARDER